MLHSSALTLFPLTRPPTFDANFTLDATWVHTQRVWKPKEEANNSMHLQEGEENERIRPGHTVGIVR